MSINLYFSPVINEYETRLSKESQSMFESIFECKESVNGVIVDKTHLVTLEATLHVLKNNDEIKNEIQNIINNIKKYGAIRLEYL